MQPLFLMRLKKNICVRDWRGHGAQRSKAESPARQGHALILLFLCILLFGCLL